MPRAAPRPCPGGCRALVEGGGRCPACRARALKSKAHRYGSSYAKGYDSSWRRLRGAFLAEHPVCVFMLDDGQGGKRMCGKPATVADHIHTFRDRPELRLDPTNLQPLCLRCSGIKTARCEGAFGRKPSGGGESTDPKPRG